MRGTHKFQKWTCMVQLPARMHSAKVWNVRWLANLWRNVYLTPEHMSPTRHGVHWANHFLSCGIHEFWPFFVGVKISQTMVCFIYILDSSNSSSFTFWTSQFTSSSRCNWTGISTVNSNGSWNDKHSCHFSTAKEIRVKATFFFM